QPRVLPRSRGGGRTRLSAAVGSRGGGAQRGAGPRGRCALTAVGTGPTTHRFAAICGWFAWTVARRGPPARDRLPAPSADGSSPSPAAEGDRGAGARSVDLSSVGAAALRGGSGPGARRRLRPCPRSLPAHGGPGAARGRGLLWPRPGRVRAAGLRRECRRAAERAPAAAQLGDRVREAGQALRAGV